MPFAYCISKKSCPFVHTDHAMETGQEFLNIQQIHNLYVRLWVDSWSNLKFYQYDVCQKSCPFLYKEVLYKKDKTSLFRIRFVSMKILSDSPELMKIIWEVKSVNVLIPPQAKCRRKIEQKRGNKTKMLLNVNPNRIFE